MLGISEMLLKKIREEGERSYPEECCGFLIGRVLDGQKIISEIQSASNARTDGRQRRYLITSEDYRRVESASRAKRLEIVGFYHSHPDHDARPSQVDNEHAWPWFSYTIVSVQGGESKAIRSWILHGDRDGFSEEKVHIEQPPQKDGDIRASTLGAT